MSMGFGRVTITAAVDTSKAALIAGAECGGVSITTKAALRFLRSAMIKERELEPSGMTLGASIPTASLCSPHSVADRWGSASIRALARPCRKASTVKH